MNQNTREKLFSQARRWVFEAGEMIRQKIDDPMIIDTKSNANDLVTTVDKDTEKFFAQKIRENYPEHLLFGEEGYGDEIKSLQGTVWIVDPIDGTMNFVHQKRNFAISVGIYHDGIGEIGLIYDVIGDVLYHAQKDNGAYKNEIKLKPLSTTLQLKESILGMNHFWLCENSLVDEQEMQRLVKTVRGTRTMGSAALEMAYVAEGTLDGYLAMRLSPWDIAAGMIIIHEVGGVTTDRHGNPINLLERSSMITCNKQIQEEIINDFLEKGKK
jgi:myo-inositol-1(or 4)-monophosphatase